MRNHRKSGWSRAASRAHLSLVLTIPALFAALGHSRGDETPGRLEAGWWAGDDFAWVRGANYVPSYALNDIEQWLEYDAAVIDRELELATRLRVNSVRVWLQYYAYEVDRERFLLNYEDFLGRCSRRGIRPMMVLFDGCFGADPGPDAKGWVANPGPERMKKTHWPKLREYLDNVVGRHVGDPRILMWDVMNEPSSLGAPVALGKDPEYAWDFARAFCDRVNEMDGTHPTTVGVGHHSHIPYVRDHVDVVTYHNYQPFEKAFDLEIAAARDLAAGKAVLITETIPNDMGQGPETTFRTLRKHRIGWYFWHLVIGEQPLTVTTSVFTTDGQTYWPDYLAAVLGFRVAPQSRQKRLDGRRIAEIVMEAETVPTTEATFDGRRRAAEHLGRSLAWAGVDFDDWKTVIERHGETNNLWQKGRKDEACALLDANLRILRALAKENDFFDEFARSEGLTSPGSSGKGAEENAERTGPSRPVKVQFAVEPSRIRGANYVPSYASTSVGVWKDFDPDVIERELAMAAKLSLNSVRVFLQYVVYEHAPEQFLERVATFVDIAERHGIRPTFVLFDSCFGDEPSIKKANSPTWVNNPGYSRIGGEHRAQLERYVSDIVKRFRGDSRVLIWDIMNEPMADFVHVTRNERDAIWRFCRHFCEFVKQLEPARPITVGHAVVEYIPKTLDLVDVISVHSYSRYPEWLAGDLELALGYGRESGKPVIVSEFGNPGAGQPYEMALDVIEGRNLGFYFWELMIGKVQFKEMAGLVYPDGTIRQATPVARLLGFRVKEGAGIPLKNPPDGSALKDLVEHPERWEGLLDKVRSLPRNRKSVEPTFHALATVGRFCARPSSDAMEIFEAALTAGQLFRMGRDAEGIEQFERLLELVTRAVRQRP